ncbi:MAG TPA: LemA family protein [Actinoplanes sp.]
MTSTVVIGLVGLAIVVLPVLWLVGTYNKLIRMRTQVGASWSQIAYARQFVTYAVQQYNTAIEGFPTNLIAGPFSFHKRDLFAAAEAERDTVRVSF